MLNYDIIGTNVLRDVMVKETQTCNQFEAVGNHARIFPLV